MSIMDIFRSSPVNPEPVVPAAPTPATPPVTPEPATPPVATPPALPAPLDAFSNLWETAPTDPNAQPASVFGGPIDPAKVFEAAKGANFAGTISQENLAKIAAGGQEAVVAFQEAINSATQSSFAQSTLAATKLIEQALAKQAAQFQADLPGLVKRHSAADSLHTENPALSNPAAAPIIQAVQAQLAIKHPNATASQLTAMAKDYLNNFAAVVAPPPAPKAEPSAAAGTDWSKFLE